MDQDEIKKYYDIKSIEKLKGFVNGNKRVDRAWDRLQKLDIKPKNILEVGCGVGDFAWKMSQKWKNAQVTGWDISERSIELAKKVFQSGNLEYFYYDTIDELPNRGKYDLIVFIDVYEHIHIKQRNQLFEFLTKNKLDNSTIFLSCPTPRHLMWLEKNMPQYIQPVDNHIYVEDLLDFAKKVNLMLTSYNEISVWSKGDYFHGVLSHYDDWEKYSDKEKELDFSIIPLKKEIYRRILKKININYSYTIRNGEPQLSRKDRYHMVINAGIDL